MEKPLVTVITVTYNAARYVRDAVESVLSQQYANIEYIIGDDCSTDNTWDIVNEYRDSRIKSYRNQTNLREYANRNKALEMSTGKYILFIDGDDLVYPHGLSYMVTMLEAFPESALAIVGYDCPQYIYPLEFTPEEIYKFQFFSNGFLSYSMAGNLFHRSALKEQGWFPINFISGDYYVRLKICQKHKCLIIGGNPVWARATPGQASIAAGSEKGRAEIFLISKQFIEDPACPLNAHNRRQALYNTLQPAARTIVKNMLMLRWNEAISLKKELGWNWRDVRDYFSATPDRSYMSEYNATHLLKMDFNKNPYSINYKQ